MCSQAQNGLQRRQEMDSIFREDQNGLQRGVEPNGLQSILETTKIAKERKKVNQTHR